ncbi:hypothetical protein IMSAG250_00370 [Clostridiales bacterium]|nr:hypothetical protein IMSAG250_00370 [Clostridiales bacterium]
MNENIIKEKLDELFEQASKRLSENIIDKYANWMEVFDEEIKDPIQKDIVMISYAQTQTLLAIKEVFDKLFTE